MTSCFPSIPNYKSWMHFYLDIYTTTQYFPEYSPTFITLSYTNGRLYAFFDRIYFYITAKPNEIAWSIPNTENAVIEWGM